MLKIGQHLKKLEAKYSGTFFLPRCRYMAKTAQARSTPCVPHTPNFVQACAFVPQWLRRICRIIKAKLTISNLYIPCYSESVLPIP